MTEITQVDREALAVAHDGRRDALARNLRDQEYDLSLFPPSVVSSIRALATQRVKHEAEIAEARAIIAPLAELGRVEHGKVTIAVESKSPSPPLSFSEDGFRRAAAFMERTAK